MAQQTQQEPNAVDMLKKDHQDVTQLFEQCERAAAADRQPIANQIFNALDVHTILEEEIFYPAVREQVDFDEVLEEEELESEEASTEEVESEEEADESDDIIALSYQEHQMVKDLIKQLKTMDVQSSDYKERFAELKEAVLDHASEEEELIFPAARLKLDLNALGNEMQQRRIALVSSMAA
jgi:Hemerythrin HHE cation binding domain.